MIDLCITNATIYYNITQHLFNTWPVILFLIAVKYNFIDKQFVCKSLLNQNIHFEWREMCRDI